VLILVLVLGIAACSPEEQGSGPDRTQENIQVTVTETSLSSQEIQTTQTTSSEEVQATPITGSAGNENTQTPAPGFADQMYPDILDASLEEQQDGTYDVSVTVSSPYDSQERYADAWRLLTPAGEEIAVRILTHPHANEQPFTRSLTGVEIPEGVERVVVQGRDLVNGWGGETIEVAVPGR